MSKEKEIILPDDPRAATLQTVTGWVSRDGFFYGNDERTARYSGSTHRKCEKCGGLIERNSFCRTCADRAEVEKFEAMPRKEWHEKSILYSVTKDCYYNTPDDAEDDIDIGGTLEDLRLIICEPNYCRAIDSDYCCDELADDQDEPPAEVLEAMDAFNEAVSGVILSWSPGKFALQPSADQKGVDHDTN